MTMEKIRNGLTYPYTYAPCCLCRHIIVTLLCERRKTLQYQTLREQLFTLGILSRFLASFSQHRLKDVVVDAGWKIRDGERKSIHYVRSKVGSPLKSPLEKMKRFFVPKKSTQEIQMKYKKSLHKMYLFCIIHTMCIFLQWTKSLITSSLQSEAFAYKKKCVVPSHCETEHYKSSTEKDG